MNTAQQVIEIVKAGDVAGIEALLSTDPALVNSRDDMGNSALLLALYYGHREIADILLAKGADLNIFEAAAAGKLEQVSLLLDKEPALLSAYSHDGFTALHLAAFFGHIDALQFLLDRGANPNAVAHNPMSVMPLHSAAAHYRADVAEAMAKALLSAGAEVNARQEGGFTALHAAAQSGNLGLIRLLLASGADINAAANGNKTALAFAEEHDHADAARLLRQSGAR